MVKLSRRLQLVADKVKKNRYIADIGTDHALIPIYLVQNKIVKRAIASDIVPGICKKVKEQIDKIGFSEYIKVIVSDGLKNVKDKDVDTIIIAGMGGILVCDILSASKRYLHDKTLILSPHRDVDLVRIKLHELGFKIVSEEILEDRKDKFYNVIVAKEGKDLSYSSLDYELGKKLINKRFRDDEFIKYLKYQINKMKKNISKMKLSKNIKTNKEINEIELKIEVYEKLLNKKEIIDAKN